MSRLRRIDRAWFLLILLASTAGAQSQGTGKARPAPKPAPRAPDLAAIVKAGQASLRRMETQSASWTATTRMARRFRGVVEVVTTPTIRRCVFSVENQGRRTELLRLIERDGYWYATSDGKSGRYRPYEAPCDLPSAYFFLARSEPHFVARPEGVGNGTFEGVSNGIVTYRSPLPESLQRLLRGSLADVEALMRRDKQEASNPDNVELATRMRDLLQKGIPIRVEPASGLIVQYGTADRTTDIKNFRWLDQVPPKTFDVEGVEWEDNASDPTAGDRDELLMIGHAGAWRPGAKSEDTDARLLDLKTGRYRRVPYQGALALPGCFLKDRSGVVVTGLDAIDGGYGIVEINLKTGANRKLGGEPLTGGITLRPALSPDGKTIAVLHRGAAERPTDAHVFLVDLATNKARAIGQSADMANPSWLPDGKGLILVAREKSDPSEPFKPQAGTLLRMDLDGKITKLRDAAIGPVLLNDGRTILYQDAKSQTWQTCNLDGGEVKPFAGGLTGFGYPAPAPDGKRLAMIRFAKGQPPVPTILNLGESEGKAAINDPGLWAFPAWR
jgi:hypothetical protein